MLQNDVQKREDMVDDFGVQNDHERMDFKRQIVDQRINIVKDEGAKGWQDVSKFLYESNPRALHFVMNQFRNITGKIDPFKKKNRRGKRRKAIRPSNFNVGAK